MTAEQLARDVIELGIELLENTGEATGGDPQRLTAGDLVTIAGKIRDVDHDIRAELVAERNEARQEVADLTAKLEPLQRRYDTASNLLDTAQAGNRELADEIQTIRHGVSRALAILESLEPRPL